jgi:tetrapyrrole methylase family protein/MazG family protein
MNRDSAFERLVNIMVRLRSENGCPWDKEQTRETLKPYLIEEAYELLEAIEKNDPHQIKEELGDLLFQIIFHCQIASEQGEFDVWDVLESITEKMLNRHPHVFGDDKIKDSSQVLQRWEEHKKREGKLKDSVLEGIPAALPSLLRAHRVQERASRVGFDWSKREKVYEKLKEELREFEAALEEGSKDEIESEIGDLLFSLVNISRFSGINPEDALRRTTDKFIKRFKYIEEEARKQGKHVSELTLSEMDNLWEEAKLLNEKKDNQ